MTTSARARSAGSLRSARAQPMKVTSGPNMARMEARNSGGSPPGGTGPAPCGGTRPGAAAGGPGGGSDIAVRGLLAAGLTGRGGLGAAHRGAQVGEEGPGRVLVLRHGAQADRDRPRLGVGDEH